MFRFIRFIKSLRNRLSSLESKYSRIDEIDKIARDNQGILRRQTEEVSELYRLISEKHEMIVDAKNAINEIYALISEKHEMIVESNKRIEELFRLASEKHSLIMEDRAEINQIYKYIILDYYKGDNVEIDKEKKEILRYLEENELSMYPYDWKKEYDKYPVEIKEDSNKRKYILHNGHRLYFPLKWDEKRMEEYYRFLVMEQDKRSPHLYFTSGFDPDLDHYDLWIDCGAAEGLITLDHIECFEKAFLIECDNEWSEALRVTFEPYKEKVEVIRKMVNDVDSEYSITLDTLIGDKKKCLIKMDIEGWEREALKGLTINERLSKDSMIAVCAYHKQDDYAIISNYLDKNKVEYSVSDGYLLSDWGGVEKPFFRRGIIRARI